MNKRKRLVCCLKFLAMSRSSKEEFLSTTIIPSEGVQISDDGRKIMEPSRLMAHIAWKSFTEDITKSDRDAFREIRELVGILTVMLDQAAIYPYLWSLTKEVAATGPADALWEAMQRISAEAIVKLQAGGGPPECVFADLWVDSA